MNATTANRPAAGSVYRFTRAHERATYGDTAVVVSVADVYPARAHPGPAFTTWVTFTTANGTRIERTIGQVSRTMRPTSGV